jgi:large subunit ribosomal protein L21
VKEIMKAVVKVGGKQYIVSEKETLLVDRLPDGTKELTLDAYAGYRR